MSSVAALLKRGDAGLRRSLGLPALFQLALDQRQIFACGGTKKYRSPLQGVGEKRRILGYKLELRGEIVGCHKVGAGDTAIQSEPKPIGDD